MPATKCFAELHGRGISVMAGFIAGFDGDTPQGILGMADRLYDIGVDVPFLSVLTPYKGTPLYDRLQAEGRLLPRRNWSAFNGYNTIFQPRNMSPADLTQAHRALWRRALSPAHALKRIARASRYLSPGAWLMTACMNGLYGLKQMRGNAPTVYPAGAVATAPADAPGAAATRENYAAPPSR